MVAHSYKHIWKRQVFPNTFLVLLVHKQVLHEVVLSYFALFILLDKFKSRLNLYRESVCPSLSLFKEFGQL